MREIVPVVEKMKDLAAACAKLKADNKAALEEDRTSPWKTDGADAEATCEKGAKAAPPRGPALEVFGVRVNSTAPGPYNVAFAGEVLAVRTAAALYLTDVRLDGKETAMFWTVDYTKQAAEWAGEGGPVRLVVRVKEHRVTDSDGLPEYSRPPPSPAPCHTTSTPGSHPLARTFA